MWPSQALLRGSMEDAEALNAPGDYLVSLGLGTACREDKHDEKILPKHAKAPLVLYIYIYSTVSSMYI